MFDIGFFEICLIGIIALIVIGPEKLPRAARTVGLWVGKARGAVKTVKYEIDEQLRMEELKQSLQKASETIESNVTEAVDDIETGFKKADAQTADLINDTSEQPKSTEKEAN